MKQASHSMTFANIPGGPCPVCNQEGFLLGSDAIYGPDGTRSLIHTVESGHVWVCEIPLTSGSLLVLPDATWGFAPSE